jgi:polysaccharide biosynthesis transport protein
MSNKLPVQSDGSRGRALDEAGTAGQGFRFEPETAPEVGAPQRLKRYLAAVRRHKWVIIVVSLLGAGLGYGASHFVKPTYEAQTILWVEVSRGGSERQGPLRTGELLQSSAWIDLLKSFVVLDHVVRERQLYVETAAANRPAFSTFALEESFRPGKYKLEVASSGESYILTSSGAEVQRGSLREPIGQIVGFSWIPPAGTIRPGKAMEFEILNPRDAAIVLSRELRATLAAEGNFLRLSLPGKDPEQISRTLNTLTSRYVQVAAEIKRGQLDELTGVLDEQRRYAEDNLHDAELQLEQFRVATVTLPSDRGGPVAAGLQQTQDPVMSRFFQLQIELDQLRNDREAVERIVQETAQSRQTLDALAMVPAAQTAPALMSALAERLERRAELRAVQQRYTGDHPSVIRLQENISDLEERAIPRLAGELRSQLMSREGELRSRIGSASNELRLIPPRAIEEARLERRVSIAENLHSMLKQRFEEVRLSAASTIPDIRVLDPAVMPTRPSSDPRQMMIFFGLLGGLALSVGGVIMRDQFDPHVRYPDEVTYGMGLSILGVVPNVDQSGKGLDEASVQAAEAFREIRMNLVYAHGAAGPVMLTITSPGSGDGKSFLTSNLALAFSDQGYRTLIIDADVRRGVLHRTLGCERVPGLTDYLAGHANLNEVLQPTRYPNVFVIPAGTRMKDGPELLGTERMAKLLLELKTRYRAILVDSPPLGAGVDAFGLGTLTRNLLLVLRTGTTDRALTTAKLGMVDRLPIRLLGAVLNGTPADSTAYRYYSYLPGYSVQPEEEAAAAAARDETEAQRQLQEGRTTEAGV